MKSKSLQNAFWFTFQVRVTWQHFPPLTSLLTGLTSVKIESDLSKNSFNAAAQSLKRDLSLETVQLVATAATAAVTVAAATVTSKG